AILRALWRSAMLQVRGEAKRMKMTTFEKFFVNSAGRSRRVAECAERMLRLVGFAAGQNYLDFGCGSGAAAVHLESKLGLKVKGIDVDLRKLKRRGRGVSRPQTSDFSLPTEASCHLTTTNS